MNVGQSVYLTSDWVIDLHRCIAVLILLLRGDTDCVNNNIDSSELIDLTEKTAIVTGGTKGIGRAIAESLIQAGASVVITARHQDEITKAVSQLNKRSRGIAKGYVCDVRDYNQVKSLFANVGAVDILINNAGVGIFASVESMSVEDFRTVLETNVFGVFYCCHEAIPLMKQRGGGHIINISSLAGANAHPQDGCVQRLQVWLERFQ